MVPSKQRENNMSQNETTAPESCALCGSVDVKEISETRTATNRAGHTFPAVSIYTKCNSCGAELVHEGQSVVNQKRFLEAEKCYYATESASAGRSNATP